MRRVGVEPNANLSGPDPGHRTFEVAGGAKNAVRAAILSEGSEVDAALSAQ